MAYQNILVIMNRTLVVYKYYLECVLSINALKSVAILIDDFSDRVHEYGNTYLYDYSYSATNFIEDQYYDSYSSVAEHGDWVLEAF